MAWHRQIDSVLASKPRKCDKCACLTTALSWHVPKIYVSLGRAHVSIPRPDRAAPVTTTKMPRRRKFSRYANSFVIFSSLPSNINVPSSPLRNPEPHRQQLPSFLTRPRTTYTSPISILLQQHNESCPTPSESRSQERGLGSKRATKTRRGLVRVSLSRPDPALRSRRMQAQAKATATSLLIPTAAVFWGRDGLGRPKIRRPADSTAVSSV